MSDKPKKKYVTPKKVKTEISKEYTSLANAMQQTAQTVAAASKSNKWNRWFHTSTS